MQVHEEIRKYSRTTCEQIRWKKAHEIISEEIENHLIDQRDAYIASGEDEAAATEHAIKQMGDPVEIGAQLDRTHRPKPQWSMFFLTAALLFTGLFVRLVVIDSRWDRELIVQLLAIVIGLGIMAAAYFIDFTLIGRYPKTFFLVIMVVTVPVIFLSPELNGRSYYAGFMPLLYPLGFSAVIYAFRNKGYRGLVASCFTFLLPCFMTLLVPTVAGLLLFACCGAVLLLFSVLSNWFGVKKLFGGLIVAAPFAAVLTMMLMSQSFRMRLVVALNPAADPNGAGFMGMMIREMLAGSKLIGHGASLPSNIGLVSSPRTDTVQLLANLIHSAGWLAFIVVMGVLLFFIVQGFILCARQKSVIGRLVSTSVMLTFTAQVVGYVLYNLGYPLTDPISLPLISYGNAAMVINLLLIGLMMSVFRTGDVVRDKNSVGTRLGNIVTWDDGKLITAFYRK